MIGDEIEVQILGVEGEFVKIGFSAPKNVQIMRKELYESIVEENNAAEQATMEMQDIKQILKHFKK